MPIDPDDPPIWLRKLYVSAAQINPSDYPASPEEGILQVCRLSDAVRAHSKTISESRSPEDIVLLKLADGRPGAFEDVMTIVDNAQAPLDLDYLWSEADRLGIQSELRYVLHSSKP